MSRPVHSRPFSVQDRSWKRRWQAVGWVQNFKELEIPNLNLAFQSGFKQLTVSPWQQGLKDFLWVFTWRAWPS